MPKISGMRLIFCTIIVCLFASLSVAQRTQGQTPATLKPLQIKQTVKPTLLKMAFANGLRARIQGSNAAFAPEIEASYRNPNDVIEIEYTRPIATTDCRLEVFAFNAPSVIYAYNKKGGSTMGTFFPSMETMLSKPLGRVGSKRVFQIPLAEFSPVFRPTPKSGTIQNPGQVGAGIVLNPGSYSGAIGLPRGKARNTAFAKNLLDSGVPVTFYCRIIDAEGVASSTCSVVVGEPMPPATVRTLLEANTVRATPEFPEEQFGQAITMSGEAERKFRFRAFGPYSTAIFQVSAIPFPADPRKWREDSCNLFRQSSAIPKATPGSAPTAFWARLAKLPTPTKSDQQFYARLVLLDEFGALAAIPSSPITITVPKVPTPPPAKESWMEFNIEVVGYQPGHVATDQDAHHFVLNKLPTGKMKEHIQKVSGKSSLALGDKLYLPPTPPADKTWWESVKEAVAEVIATINDAYMTVQGVINTFQSVAMTTLSLAPKAFLVTIPSTFGINMSGVETALDYGNKINNYAHYPLSIPNKIQENSDYYTNSILESAGLSPQQRLLARGQVKQAIVNWAYDNRPWNGKYLPDMLIPDPDWLPKPDSIKLRVTSIGKGKPDPNLLAVPPTVDIKFRVFSKNVELLGPQGEWRDVFQKTATFPKMGPNETMEVTIQLDYHWSHYAQPDIWTNAIYTAQKALVTVNGKSKEFVANSGF